MIYQSTRDHRLAASSTRAVLDGIAPDGGLYILDDLASLDFDWRGALEKDTMEMSAQILSALLPEFQDMSALVQRGYEGKFETDELTPLAEVGDRYVLELFRGPTSAFKDVALSLLPRLITAARDAEGMRDEIVILTATSGDTGKAALEGFHDVTGTRIIVFYPHGGVSAVQQAQMTTQQGDNVCVCAVRGNFDDAQTGVKNIFAACADGKLLEGKGIELSSANSINIGRLAPQITYYFKAYADLMARGEVKLGEKVNFCVPTGNFGDILAGYLAKLLGLPVGKLICASNTNKVLSDFIHTGTYDRKRPLHKTDSPSMDILVSSNLERLLYLLSGRNTALVADLMKQLNTEGKYTVPAELKAAIDDEFWGDFAGDAETSATINKVWKEQGYLCDTHTAVGWYVAENYVNQTGDHTPMVVLSTASPYKFPAAVLSAIGGDTSGDEFEQMERLSQITGVPIPGNLTGLKELEELHTGVIDKEDMLSFVLGK